MNELIKVIALDAGFAYEPTKDQLWVSGPIEVMISPGLEKFAELLIRECHDVVFHRTGARSALNILEHFGLEE